MSADYDVAASFEYQPVKVNLEDLQLKALQNRPDLRAAQQGVTAARQPVAIAKGERQTRCHRVRQLLACERHQRRHCSFFSIPLAIFNRNQGEIARAGYAITQAKNRRQRRTGRCWTT